jgi:hypothetical protein
MKKLTFACIALAMSSAALAKLPPQSPEAQAAAAAAKDKTAWSDKVAAYQLCLAQDKTAKHYFKTKNQGGKPSTEVPACADPGPYVAAQATTAQVGVADSKPVPAAGKPAEPAAKK